METKVFKPSAVDQAAALIAAGQLVAFPTETVYGLGADATNVAAVKQVYQAKGRPSDNPLIVHVAEVATVERFAKPLSINAKRLIKAFWPGPLTMIFNLKPDALAPEVTGGLTTAAFRNPANAATIALIKAAKTPIVGPSANTSGKPSPTTAQHVLHDLDGKIAGILDDGATKVGVESTVLDLSGDQPAILRPGAVTAEAIEAVIDEPVLTEQHHVGVTEVPKAPGMKYRHYAPKAPVTVITGTPGASAAYIAAHLTKHSGVICFDEYAPLFEGHTIHRLGPAGDKLAQAQHVFDALRTFDGTDVTEIFAQCPDEGGLGLAVGNRLKKAAGFHVIEAPRPLIVGITGPTGAGKTSALRALEQLGGCVLDCDAIYHDMLRSDDGLRNAITSAFGNVFTPDGRLDRQKLGTLVFGDPQQLERLNTIIYANIPRELERRMAASPAPIVGIDAINLVESGLSKLCDRTLAVLAPVEDRIRRIMARDGISEEYARLRVAAQKDDVFYRTHCTDILENTSAAPEAFQNTALLFFQRRLTDHLKK